MLELLSSLLLLLHPLATTINLSVDLAGSPDTRVGTWGNAEASATTIHFSAPPGYHTRITHVYGDFVAWPKYGWPSTGSGQVEVGFGIKTTEPDGSSVATYPGWVATPYDNSFLWVQGGLVWGQSALRIPIDITPHSSPILLDNTAILQTFVAINTTTLIIHMEPTIRVEFVFEKTIVDGVTPK
jgi:hypothetical protein